MTPRRPTAPVLAVALGILLAPPAWAASPTEVLQAFYARANNVLRSADPDRGIEEPRQAIRTLVNEVFDYPDAAERALGPTWQTKTPTQQAEFVRLFADFLERGYVAFIGSRASLAGGVTVQYLSEAIVGESAAVATSLLTRNGSDLDVEYSMVRHGERWMVRDVVIDGVSLVMNYRAQFSRILRTTSYGDLLARMRGGGAEAPQPAIVTAAPLAPRPTPPPVIAPPAARQELRLASRASEDPAPKVEAVRVSAAEPVKPVPDAPASTGPVAAATRYWVQVGAFKTVNAAIHLAAELRRQGMAASNDPRTTTAGHSPLALARVRVGPFASRSDAVSKLRELVARGYAPFIAEARD